MALPMLININIFITPVILIYFLQVYNFRFKFHVYFLIQFESVLQLTLYRSVLLYMLIGRGMHI